MKPIGHTHPADRLPTVHRGAFIVLALLLLAVAQAQGSEISYQGQLRSNDLPFSGTANLQFRLFNQATGGSQVGPVLLRPNWPVQDGLFQVDLDFGAGVFDGSSRYLEVQVNGIVLAPRQAIRAVPLALHVMSGGGSGPWSVDGSGAVEYLVNGQRFRFQPVTGLPQTSPNLVVGHASNSVAGYGSAVLSGGALESSNDVEGNFNVIAGGRTNQIDAFQSVISGGSFNFAQGSNSTIGGGTENQVEGISSTVSGGRANQASGVSSSVGGGAFNTASEDYSTVAGGNRNQATGTGSTVSGGGATNRPNIASGEFSVVGGGFDNQAIADFSVLSGGRENTVGGAQASVGGGQNNQASAEASTVGGGSGNMASGLSATVSGGSDNQASSDFTTVGGGSQNRASRQMATVSGGFQNTASHDFATVPGGWSNCAGAPFSWAGGRRAKVRRGEDGGPAVGACANVPSNGGIGDQGSFVWADAQNQDFLSNGPNQFMVRAAGGVGFGRAPSDYFVIDSGRVLQDSDYSFGTGALRVLMNHSDGSVLTMLRVMGNGGLAVGNSFNSSGVPERGMRIHGLLALNALGSGGGVSLCRNANNEVANCGSSSERYKFDIEDLENPMALVAALRPVRYRWIDGGEVDIGLIAEEVAEQVPALAIHFDGRLEGVKYDRLAAVLLGAIQQQQLEIQALRTELAVASEQLRHNAELELRLLALESVLLDQAMPVSHSEAP